VKPTVGVVVPARNEEARIGACLEALAAQRDVDLARVLVVLVLDDCSDGTRAMALAVAARRPALRLCLINGSGMGAGPARALGMRHARDAIDSDDRFALLLSTDADTRVGPAWIASQIAAVGSGSLAIGGLIELDPDEARRHPAAVETRARRAPGRLLAVRRHTAGAEHHHFSGASFALTPATYDRIGGLPDPEVLEDEALERHLRERDVPICYLRSVQVVTSARLNGRVRGAGLAHALRAAVGYG